MVAIDHLLVTLYRCYIFYAGIESMQHRNKSLHGKSARNGRKALMLKYITPSLR